MRSAALYDAQRARLDQRAKLLPRRTPAERIVVVVGGAGTMRRLCERLGHELVALHGAVLLGVQPSDDPIEVTEAIRASAEGRPPRVLLLGPIQITRPLVDTCNALNRRFGLGWAAPLDLLDGLRQRDREAMVRHAIRLVKGGA